MNVDHVTALYRNNPDGNMVRLRTLVPVSAGELRGADPMTLREQRRAHYIAVASFFAECGVSSAADLKASQKREYDKRCRAIAAIEAGIPAPTNLLAARARLLNRSN